MADRSHDGAERDAKETCELFYTEQNENKSAFGLDQSHLQKDHSDLLLDAIDTQLGQLQVQSQKYERIARRCDCSVSALPRSSQSPRKDMGLESRSLMNDSPMSCLDFLHTPTVEKTVQKDNRNNLSLFCSTSEWSTHCPEDPVIHKETKKTLDIGTRDNEEIESQKEQVIWRLERLLKDACIGSRLAGETQSLSDSVCTEDFVRRFKEEMVETAFSETNMQDMEIEDEAQWTEISNTDTFRNEQKEQSALIARRIGPVMTWKSSEATMIAHHSLSSKPCQRKELKRCLSENYRANMCMSHSSKKPGPEQRYKAPQTVDDDGSSKHKLTH
ncbi:hypothetical protein EXN66_Car011466 [Channa argus]|uniref:Uncharacterized protein n=1 Tax=Channa argus TaxID=215402 RepID=A0A6G1PZM8_CHAAH|nr:hypothetical protein EXN66_Car011466 [Channa argus]